MGGKAAATQSIPSPAFASPDQHTHAYAGLLVVELINRTTKGRTDTEEPGPVSPINTNQLNKLYSWLATGTILEVTITEALIPRLGKRHRFALACACYCFKTQFFF